MSSSDEDNEERDEEEEIPDPSDVPNLSDSENTDDSDADGASDDHDSGRCSPDQPENEDDDIGTDPDTDGEYEDNDEPKNGLPGLTTPGDSGFEYSSDSDSEGEPLAIKLGKENVSYRGTAEFQEYADKTNNAPGSTKVEGEELRCPKLSTGEICHAHKSEEDMKFFFIYLSLNCNSRTLHQSGTF